MRVEKVDQRPYIWNQYRIRTECVVCGEPIWDPHAPMCWWADIFPPIEPAHTPVEDVVVVAGCVFAAWMVGTVIASFL